MGILRREDHKSGSRVKAKVIGSPTAKILHVAEVREHLKQGAIRYTDAWAGYRRLDGDYRHLVIDHAVAYANGAIHRQGVESFRSHLKRSIKGTYVSVEPFHFGRYLDEQALRFNEREGVDGDRLCSVLSAAFAERVECSVAE